MYLGMSLMIVGMAILTGSFWFILAVSVAIMAVTRLSIEPEKAYLERRFGSDYLDYRRVRQWS
jgi:protein-S-isoprenylcysteine O-methyltransferase Ste14